MESPTHSQQQQTSHESQPGTPSTPGESTSEQSPNNSTDAKKKRTGPKRRKVTHACVYCRRSHMTCDDGSRPCQRCIKRSIGHMCHDEPKHANTPQTGQTVKNRTATSAATTPISVTGAVPTNGVNNVNYMSLASVTHSGGLPLPFFGQIGTGQLTFASEHMGNEISVISTTNTPTTTSTPTTSTPTTTTTTTSTTTTTVNTAEKFFLTAADPSDGRLEDRLTEVINAKYEAGFLKPYNYVNGYARLQKYMDSNMSTTSRQRILNVMGTFRPAFRSVAQSLTDIDLILVEEAFERLLLDYDRVFSSMGIPACLWRRTGEISKGNKEFASLVNVPIESLREGRLCIYELMAEESAVNYWEKYGNIAFDPGQKAVLTSCLLKSPTLDTTSVISCCFSFTIRRDKYNIPTVIVGNFLPVQLH
ncbi:hypothetical protein BDF14DRAFT_1723387 [Spinellus fusiger]|nr:hypothetical protein BDF14DRAFT_1723387 [Spinellus fusiger]